MKEVVILQHRLLHYRQDLFNRLREDLRGDGVNIRLLSGQPSEAEAKRKDLGTLSWSSIVDNIFFSVRGVDVLWQRIPLGLILSADLIVLMQENRILSNYFIIILRKIVGKKVAFWGHGRNMQSSSPVGLRETWKKWWLKSVDWWFCYTQGTVEYVVRQGFCLGKVTNLNNAIDTHLLKSDLEKVSMQDLIELRVALGINQTDNVAIFCGSIYRDKKVQFLIDSCDLVAKKDASFKLVVIGSGPDELIVKEAMKTRPWLVYVGAKKGLDNAKHYRLGKLMLNPGLVGLHILDSFASGLPMITTKDAPHSPEFAYMIDGQNGVVIDGDEKSYAEAILRIFQDQLVLDSLIKNCLDCASQYTVESMVNRFRVGISECIAG